MTAKKRISVLLVMAVMSVFFLTRPVLSENFSADDEEFLNKLEHDSFLYFIKEINPQNGLIKDSSRPGSPCSVAAVGFGLAAICVGESKGWISRKEAHDMILKILYTFRYGAEHEKGFFYRLIDMENGGRFLDSEISSIDTAIFIAGALFAAEYFKGTDIERSAREIYDRVEWPWMMSGRNVLHKAWSPEDGFSFSCWDSYSEAMILYALAIGSSAYPVEKDAWLSWKRPVDRYLTEEIIYAESGSLYTYYYSHIWIDFRRLFDPSTTLRVDPEQSRAIDPSAKAQDQSRASEARRGTDGNINYFDNSVNAVKANRQFCIDNAGQYKTYGDDSWGLTACLGPEGYMEYGAKPGRALNDGTIAPSGMAGSIVFNGADSVRGLKNLYEKYKNFLYGRYGFKNAFNMDQDWWAEEYLGSDVGVTLLSIENYRTGLIWRKFMDLEPVRKWINSCLS
jgi:hypothetical protein